ncbi:MAG: TRAP-type C4-dicarboxylate transport system, large permease component [Devosia sp.]|nr:TRAP-type C4-dicarboxylate transport system, large permease component [Devosia sp.]
MSLLLLLGMFCLFLAIGIPVAFALGLASLGYVLVFLPHLSLEVLPQQMFAGADSFTLTAIPFFILIGELMNSGGISSRLVAFARAVVGRFRGGLGIVELFASMIFASFSGSSVANAAGTGSITIPAMINSGYPRGHAAAIESASSGLGAVIPPSIPMIVYGSIAGVSVGGLFVGGYVPGVLLALGLVVVVLINARRHNYPADQKGTRSEILATAKDAIPAILAPVLIMAGILGGVMTPTEAGAVGAIYSGAVALFWYREISWTDLPRILTNTASVTGVVMLIMTIAALFSWIMAFERIPTLAAEFVLGGVTSPQMLMIGIFFFLLVVGMFIDTVSALIILTPVLLPVALAAGIDPLFFGIIVSVTLSLGACTPPVGVVLFVTASIAKTSVEDVSRSLLPYLAVLFGGMLLLALLPDVVLWLPRLAGY